MQESAEAIVVKTPVETREERRAEEPRESNRSTVPSRSGVQVDETTGALQLRHPPRPIAESAEVDSSNAREAMSAQSSRRRKEMSDDAQ